MVRHIIAFLIFLTFDNFCQAFFVCYMSDLCGTFSFRKCLNKQPYIYFIKACLTFRLGVYFNFQSVNLSFYRVFSCIVALWKSRCAHLNFCTCFFIRYLPNYRYSFLRSTAFLLPKSARIHCNSIWVNSIQKTQFWSSFVEFRRFTESVFELLLKMHQKVDFEAFRKSIMHLICCLIYALRLSISFDA